MASEDRFGYEWGKYSEVNEIYESQFARWVQPLTPASFSGKRVLDVGCGMGRNSFWALKWGASEVVAFDFDTRSVEAAKRNLAVKNAQVVFKSVYESTWKDEFDIAMSIGVIHHLKEPKVAIQKMVDAVKPGGVVCIWVYGYEGNEWIVRYVDPIRKAITSKLPVGMVHLLAYACSIPLWCFVKVFRGPSAYLRQLSTFGFTHIHSIVFDQLIPEVANYWKKEEAIGLFEGIPECTVSHVTNTNNNSWTVIATKI